MQTILGAGGAIGTELARILAQSGERVRLVSRHPGFVPGAAETLAADISDAEQAARAVTGSSVVHLLVGLKYDAKIWHALWPRIMQNTIDACKRAGARLVFCENVYMYGRVAARMTEETPFSPCSRKGEVRARIAAALLGEMKAGNLTALIARSADFYGPDAKTGIPNVLVFDKLAKGQTASWLASDSVRHSFTFTSDAARSLALLAASPTAWNQTWHVPTAPNPPTGKAFIEMAAAAFGVRPKYRVLRRPVVRAVGLFIPEIRETVEMLYQYDSEYLFDSSKFSRAFGFAPTPYGEGIRRTALAYRSGG